MSYFIMQQLFLDIPFTLSKEQMTKINKFLVLLEDSGVGEIIWRNINKKNSRGGRPNLNPYRLFATIIYAFSFSKATLREIEDLCKYDMRYIYLMELDSPSYSTISNFINKIIIPNCDEIFSKITLQIMKELNIEKSIIYIDGTKFEANANKYKFVWKPLTYHKKLTQKVIDFLNKNKIKNNLKSDKLLSSKALGNIITEYAKNDNYNSSTSKVLNEFMIKILEYEEKERICGPNRNSYYKTDHDATAMALKADYYAGLGSNMHAAYNSQIGVCGGIISTFLITQSRTDINDFIGVLDHFYKLYGCFPKKVCADAGYGSLKNYEYLDKNKIQSFVKYNSWEGNVSGKNPDILRVNDNDDISCIGNKVGVEIKIENRHHKKPGKVFLKFDGCNSCEFRSYCKRFMKNQNEDFKIFGVNKNFEKLKAESEKNLLSVEGIEIRVNRSILVEGAFGDIKQNNGYTRARRRGLESVTCELMLVYLGINIKKLFSFYDSNKTPSLWTAPKNTEPESFAKLSSKRLSKKGRRINDKIFNNKHT